MLGTPRPQRPQRERSRFGFAPLAAFAFKGRGGFVVENYLNYIAGRDVAAADGRTFTAFNPTTGGVWGTFALAGPAEVDRAVKAASDAFRTGPWGKLSPTR